MNRAKMLSVRESSLCIIQSCGIATGKCMDTCVLCNKMTHFRLFRFLRFLFYEYCLLTQSQRQTFKARKPKCKKKGKEKYPHSTRTDSCFLKFFMSVPFLYCLTISSFIQSGRLSSLASSVACNKRACVMVCACWPQLYMQVCWQGRSGVFAKS